MPHHPTSSPLVSIITIVRNDESHVAQAIESGLGQSHPAIEYIVKDGQSTDGTMAAIEPYRARLAVCVSQPDRGIADAWNQALEHATGQYVLLLNSDDQVEPALVADAVRCLAESGADITYGNTMVTNADTGARKRVIGRWRPARLWQGIGFLHPGVVCTRRVYDRIGGFDTTLRYAMDADWLLRAHAAGFRFVAHGRWSTMADSGVSHLQWLAARHEYLAVLARHRASFTTLALGRLWMHLLRLRKSLRPAR